MTLVMWKILLLSKVTPVVFLNNLPKILLCNGVLPQVNIRVSPYLSCHTSSSLLTRINTFYHLHFVPLYRDIFYVLLLVISDPMVNASVEDPVLLAAKLVQDGNYSRAYSLLPTIDTEDLGEECWYILQHHWSDCFA